jgi:hypothetical protein
MPKAEGKQMETAPPPEPIPAPGKAEKPGE